MDYFKSEIKENSLITDNIYLMRCKSKEPAKAGQFYMLKSHGETFLARPLSVLEQKGQTVSFLYAMVGKGTFEFTLLEKGDSISLLGPIGNGFDLSECKGRVALVSGGIGIAPFLETSKQIRKLKPKTLDLYAGFRDEVYLLDEISEYADNVYVATDSGSFGKKGFVTEIFNPKKYDVVLVCGPTPMMKRAAAMCAEAKVKCYVSLEKHMACGVGACLGCSCKTKDGMKRTCVDGPVFDASTLEW